MQTKPSDAAFSAGFLTSINADRKQLATSFSGEIMRAIVLDKFVKFRDPCLNRSREIQPEAVGIGIFDSFSL